MESRIWVPLNQDEYFRDALNILEKEPEFNGFRLNKIDFHKSNLQPPTKISNN